jgi:biopolymer transport protein ExbB
VVGDLVAQGKIDEALKACKELKGSTARVVASAVRNLNRQREHIEDIVSEQILHESANLNRFGMFIMVIAAVGPLLGLLGTVTGMIATFDIITGSAPTTRSCSRAASRSRWSPPSRA